MKKPISILIGCSALLIIGCRQTSQSRYSRGPDPAREVQWNEMGFAESGAVLTRKNETSRRNIGGVSDDSKFATFSNGQGGQKIMILQQPDHRLAEVGTHVHFTVSAKNADSYQWKKNGTNINFATNDMLCINHASSADVASYTVQASSQFGTLVSDPAHLSVYSLFCGNSNGGFLETPKAAFVPDTVNCGDAGGSPFSSGYCPNDGNFYYLFYGPDAPNQTGPFKNESRSRYVTIHTAISTNSPADTGLRFRKNFAPLTVLCCQDEPPPPSNDTIESPAAQCGPIDLVYHGANKTYKVVVYYKSTPPASGKVSFYWLYHN